ncbi:tetratricopeptide repeat protein [Teredinibacter turnerae]|uniref:tetratricopeptide repeat protein n=1 Tax=Teredinibacter turnerae TaxID=2426 RepID=UPI00048C79FF|nr:tetratricopeptide repeat protein [Teredinibacter turnerae]
MEHRHLTLMFTDIVGYSSLMGRDQVQTIAMLEDYRRILIEQIGKQQGTVIEFIGDAVFARFDTPQAGVTAAIEIQKALFSFNHFRDKSLPQLRTRIGLHCGEVATKNDAFFGDDVNIAARLEPIAVADGICVSDRVYQSIKTELREPCMALGVLPLKNIQSKVRGYLIRPLGITLSIRAHYVNRRFNEKLGAYRYAIAASVICLILLGIYFIPRWLVPGYDANYVEIADFKMLSTDGGTNEYLSSGISDAVRAQLADMKDVYVLKTGEGVEAPILLEGSVQRNGDNLRIAYQIKRKDGDVQIAGGKLDGKYNEIFILQDRLVGEIAKYLADEFDIPNFRPARLDTTSDVLAYEYYMRGMEFYNRPRTTSNTDEAIKFFSTALVHDPGYVDAEIALCRAYVNKYLEYRDVSWIKSAEQHCKVALQLAPGNNSAIIAMAWVYTRTGQITKAIDLLTGAIEREPENGRAARALASALTKNKQPEEAVQLLQKTIAAAPKDWRSYSSLGRLYISMGKMPQAIEAYLKVLEITPKNSTVLANLGTAYYFTGNLKKARDYFQLNTEIVKTSLAYTNLGTLNYFLGDYKTASEQFQIAVDLAPSDPVNHLNYADSLRNTPKMMRFANEHYVTAIRLAKEMYELDPSDVNNTLTLVLSSLGANDTNAAGQYLAHAAEYGTDTGDYLYAKMRYEIAINRLDAANATLDALLDSGYSSALLEFDPDLEALRKMPGYQQLLAKY